MRTTPSCAAAGSANASVMNNTAIDRTGMDVSSSRGTIYPMRIPHLRHFIAAVEAGSLRAGARRAGVSQLEMTKNVRELERNLGVRLLVRGARDLQLTREGRAFLARARAIDAELRHAHDELTALRGGVAGASVDIGIGPALCNAVPLAMARF